MHSHSTNTLKVHRLSIAIQSRGAQQFNTKRNQLFSQFVNILRSKISVFPLLVFLKQYSGFTSARQLIEIAHHLRWCKRSKYIYQQQAAIAATTTPPTTTITTKQSQAPNNLI